MSTENTETPIILKQKPIIVHQLEKAGAHVQKRLDDLELDKQIVTEENRQSMKVLKAELNKEFKGYEEQRAIIKNAVSEPYKEFETVYKLHITNPFENGIKLLTEKIDAVELKMKKEKENSVKEYFDELLVAENIDFLKFEQLGLKFDLSTTEKKYKEQVYAFIEKTNDDIALIKATDYEAETMTEYKKTLNVSKAITDVKTRKDAEEKEAARIKAELIQNRKTYIEKIGLKHVEITNQWEYSEEIFVSLKDIQELSKEDFTAKYEELKVKIKAYEESIAAPVEDIKVNQHTEVTEQPKPTISAPLKAPKAETTVEPIKVAKFECRATEKKLRLLGAWMKENGIEYKNLENV